MSNMSNRDLQQFKPLYIQTARDYIDSLKKNITLLQQNSNDVETLKQARIDAHSLKSQSVMMQYNNIASFCEAVERVLTETVEKTLTLNPGILNTILQGAEKMLQSLIKIEQKDQDTDMIKETEMLKKESGII